MKAAELRKRIADIPDDVEVVIATDAEGNQFKPIDDVSHHFIYVPENAWSGDAYDTTGSAADHDMDPEDWEEFKRRDRCILLWPVN